MACVPLAFSCGGDSNNKTIHTTDAKVFKDGPPVACTATTTYGAVTLTGSGSNSNQDERSYPSKPNGSGSLAPYEEVVGVLNADAMPDILFLDLYPGYGPFKGSNNLKTGTYTITGDDLSEATCGVCPLIGTDFGSAGETDDYYAVDGSVTITSFGSANNGSNGGSGWSGTLSGSVSGMHFQHVMFASDGTQSPAGDGCTSGIDSMSFSGMLVQETRFQNGRVGYQLALQHRHFN